MGALFGFVDIAGFFFRTIYTFWTFFARIVDFLEQVFRQLAGLSPVYVDDYSMHGDYLDGEFAQNASGDIVTILLTSNAVRTTFQALVAIAVTLLVFFTIIQIIREQYRNKDGGNPYMIVFKMFKGMFTMLFITAVVIVGIQVSGHILNALDQATGATTRTRRLDDDDNPLYIDGMPVYDTRPARVSGTIFRAMAANATDSSEFGKNRLIRNVNRADSRNRGCNQYGEFVPYSRGGLRRRGNGNLNICHGVCTENDELGCDINRWATAMYLRFGVDGLNRTTLVPSQWTRPNLSDFQNVSAEIGQSSCGNQGCECGCRGEAQCECNNSVDDLWSGIPQDYFGIHRMDTAEPGSHPRQVVAGPALVISRRPIQSTRVQGSIIPFMDNRDINFTEITFEYGALEPWGLLQPCSCLRCMIDRLDFETIPEYELQNPDGTPFDPETDNQADATPARTGLIAGIRIVAAAATVGNVSILGFGYDPPDLSNVVKAAQIMVGPCSQPRYGWRIQPGSQQQIRPNNRMQLFVNRETSNTLFTVASGVLPWTPGNLTYVGQNAAQAGTMIAAYLQWMAIFDAMHAFQRMILSLVNESARATTPVPAGVFEALRHVFEYSAIGFPFISNITTHPPSNTWSWDGFGGEGVRLPFLQSGIENIVNGVIGGVQDTVNALTGRTRSVTVRIPIPGELANFTHSFHQAAAGFYRPLWNTGAGRVTNELGEIICVDSSVYDLALDGGRNQVLTVGDTNSGFIVRTNQNPTLAELERQVGAINPNRGCSMEHGERLLSMLSSAPGPNNYFVNWVASPDMESEMVGGINNIGQSSYEYAARAAGSSGDTTPGTLWQERTGMSGMTPITHATAVEDGRANYMNASLIDMLFSLNEFDWIIGFLGVLIVLGVFTSFMFGLIQRLMELMILYIMSPITLAMYPFDNGSSFQGNFIKPFYGKVIAVFAIILSLNLFFLLWPTFQQIRFFDPDTGHRRIGNILMRVFVTLALLSMLPKIRSTIQSMLGAEGIEDKSFGDVWKGATDGVGKGVKNVKTAALGGYNVGKNLHKGHVARMTKARTLKNAIGDQRAVGSARKKDIKGHNDAISEANNKLKNAKNDKDRNAAQAELNAAKAKKDAFLAANPARKGLMKSALGRALLDIDNGVLMQGDYGKLKRMGQQNERDDRIKKLNDSRKKRVEGSAKNYAEGAKHARTNGRNLEAMHNHLEKLGIEGFTSKDLTSDKGREKARAAIAAREKELAANSKGHGAIARDSEMDKFFENVQKHNKDPKQRAEAAKMAAALKSGDKDEAAAALAAYKSAGGAISDNESNVFKSAFDERSAAMKAASDGNGAAEFEKLMKTFDDAAAKTDRIFGVGGSGNAAAMAIAASQADGADWRATAKSIEALGDAKNPDKQINYGKHKGTVEEIKQKVKLEYAMAQDKGIKGLKLQKLVDYDVSMKAGDVLAGQYSVAMGAESIKDFKRDMGEVKQQHVAKISSSAAYRDLTMKHDDVAIAESMRLISIGKENDAGNKLSGDKELMRFLTSAEGRKVAGQMASIHKQFGDTKGNMTGTNIQTADNIMGVMKRAAFSEMVQKTCEGAAAEFKQKMDGVEYHLDEMKSDAQAMINSIKGLGINGIDKRKLDELGKVLAKGSDANLNKDSSDMKAIESAMAEIASAMERDPSGRLAENTSTLRRLTGQMSTYSQWKNNLGELSDMGQEQRNMFNFFFNLLANHEKG